LRKQTRTAAGQGGQHLSSVDFHARFFRIVQLGAAKSTPEMVDTQD
jgi:hypothetical protein